MLSVGTSGTLVGFDLFHSNRLGHLGDPLFHYRTARIDVTQLRYNIGRNMRFAIRLSGGTTPSDGLLGGDNFTLRIGSGAGATDLAIANAGTTTTLNFSSHGLSWSRGDYIPVRLIRDTINHHATGKPTISGTARVGQSLTAARGSIADRNGVPNTFTYQWIRVDGNTETDITNATSSSYTPVAADADKKLRVRFSFTDNASTDESSVSDAFPPTGGIEVAPPTNVLVGNYGQPSAGRRHASTKIAQDFTTGSNALGYTLDGVDIRTLDYNPFQVSVHSLTSDGRPGRSIATLTLPPIFEVGRRLRFEAPSGTNPDADTTYAVVISDISRAYAGRVRLDSTRSNAQDSSSLQGWDMEDQFRQWNRGTGRWYPDIDGLAFPVTILGAAKSSQVAVETPTVTGTPALSPAGTDQRWTAGETIEATLTFSEAVTGGITNGTPSVGIGFGAETRSASYLRSSGTRALVFGYTLVQTDGEHQSIRLDPDSPALNGGTIHSIATGTDAALAHNGTAKLGTASRDAPVPSGPTAGATGLPASHDGSAPFTFELRFSETPKDDLSYTTLKDHAFTVTTGDGTNAQRLEPPGNVRWETTVTPNANKKTVAIVLPATTDCTAEGAICTQDGRKLSKELELTVEVVNTPATDAPTISGTLRVGETLTAGTSAVADVNGMADAVFSQ